MNTSSTSSNTQMGQSSRDAQQSDAHVVDPALQVLRAGPSTMPPGLADQVAQRAWAQFQTIQAQAVHIPAPSAELIERPATFSDRLKHWWQAVQLSLARFGPVYAGATALVAVAGVFVALSVKDTAQTQSIQEAASHESAASNSKVARVSPQPTQAKSFTALVPAEQWIQDPALHMQVAVLQANQLSQLGLPFDPARADQAIQAQWLVAGNGQRVAVRFEAL